jgi:hypothetical protein
MVKLNRGKRFIQGVQSSNIQVNVPTFNALENPINVLGEMIISDDKQAELSYERELQTKENQIKLIEGDINANQKAAEALETEWIAQEEKRKDNALSLNIIKLNEKAYNLSLLHPDNPSEFKNQLSAYYEGLVENSGDWHDQNRGTKFAEKYSSLGLTYHKTINKTYNDNLNRDTWANLEKTTEDSKLQANVLISNIDNLDDLKTYFMQQESIMQYLTDRIGSYETNIMGTIGNKKTQEDLTELLGDYVYERDKAFVSHFLNNFILKDVTKENVNLAKTILKLYSRDNIPTKDDVDVALKKTNISSFSTKDIEDIVEVISMNTSRFITDKEQILTADQRKSIIQEVDGLIDEKYNQWLSNDIKMNEDRQTKINNGIIQANENLKNLGNRVYKEFELDQIFQYYDKSDQKWKTNKDKVNEYLNKQQHKVNFHELIRERIMGTITDIDFIQRANNLDLQSLGLGDRKPLAIMKEYVVKQAFGGMSLDVVSLTRDVFDKETMRNNINLMNGLHVAKKEYLFPQEFIDYFQEAHMIDMDDEVNQKHIVGMAIIKNYTFGKSSPTNLDEEINAALNDVYTAYNASKGNFAVAGGLWHRLTHKKNDIIRNNLIKWQSWYEEDNIDGGWMGGNVSGYNWMDSKISEMLDDAIDREDLTSLHAWGALIDTAITGEWGGERDFDQLVLNKDTVGIVDYIRSFWGGMNYKGQNISMTTSVVSMMDEYINENIHKYLNQENMNNAGFERALQSVMKDGIKWMSNNPDISSSSVLYLPNNPNALVFTDQSPEKLIMNGKYINDPDLILQNANAFIGNFILDEFEKNPNNASQMWFNLPADAVPVDDWDNFKRSYMSLWKNNQIKLHPVSDTMDVENPSWNIMIDFDGDGLWQTITKNGSPVEWFPNNQFTHDNSLDYNSVLNDWLNHVIEGTPLFEQVEGDLLTDNFYEMKDYKKVLEGVLKKMSSFKGGINPNFDIFLKDIKNAPDEVKQTYKNILKGIITGQEGYFANLFEGTRWFNEREINTVTELQTLLSSEFDGFQKTIQKELDFNFAKTQDVMLMQHNLKFYPKKFPKDADEKTMIKISNQHNATMLDVYNETFSTDKLGIILPPNYGFVIKDIIAADDNWKKVIGEGTPFYKDLIKGDFRYAKDKLMRLSYYFAEQDKSLQFNSWMNFWNISYNKM